jgi:hypothetical protein
MFDLTQVLEALIALLVAAVTAFVIPWIRGKMNAESLALVAGWVKIAVTAAEQIYKESGSGKDRKNYVLGFLEEKGIKIDDTAIDAMIESAVFEISTAPVESAKPPDDPDAWVLQIPMMKRWGNGDILYKADQ